MSVLQVDSGLTTKDVILVTTVLNLIYVDSLYTWFPPTVNTTPVNNLLGKSLPVNIVNCQLAKLSTGKFSTVSTGKVLPGNFAT